MLRGNHGQFRFGKTFGPVYDPDAQDYFSRAEGLGGSFNQTAIDPAYTESYIKNSINNFVLGCKSDGTWDLISEIYFYSLVSFNGLPAKLKHAGNNSITVTNFVSGDYVAAGVNAGLTDGTNKLLDLNFNPVSLPDASMGLYLQFNDFTSFGRLMGSRDNIIPTGLSILSNTNDRVLFFGGTTQGLLSAPNVGLGFFLGTCLPNEQKFYKNGTLFLSSTVPDYNIPNQNIFGLQISGITGDTTCRQSMAFIGRLLTVNQVFDFSTRVTNLMTAIGANK